MEEVKKEESHATSAAAFVEGGIQDACSICLEIFSKSDPSTVTHCKHDRVSVAVHFGIISLLLQWKGLTVILGGRERSRSRPSSDERQQRFVFSTHLNGSRVLLPKSLLEQFQNHPSLNNETPQVSSLNSSVNSSHTVASSSASINMLNNSQGISVDSSSSAQSSMTNQENADIGSEARREVNAGIASILESRESNRSPHAPVDTNTSTQGETPSNGNSDLVLSPQGCFEIKS
nr:E3 ubiquitin-protein ligase RHF2A isoform X1 [Ipomoea batatas]